MPKCVKRWLNPYHALLNKMFAWERCLPNVPWRMTTRMSDWQP